MVEGGATIITSMLRSRLADRFLLTVAPRFVGGLRAVKSQNGAALDRLPRLCNVHYQWLADDLIILGDFDDAADGAADGAADKADGHEAARTVSQTHAPSGNGSEEP
jgi:hypothetical protein